MRRQRKPGARGCPTPGCGGEFKVNWTKPCNIHTKRRCTCERCGIRITTIEKLAGGFTQADIRKAMERIGSVPPVTEFNS